MPTPIELRDAFRDTLIHVRDAYNRLVPITGPGQPLHPPDLHKLSEGLFLSAWTHWEEFCRDVMISDVSTVATSVLRREVRRFRTRRAPWRLAERIVNHPDHPDRFVEWNDYDTIRSRADAFLGVGHRFVALGNPLAPNLKRLKKIRNAIAHRSDKAWDDFIALVTGAPFNLAPARPERRDAMNCPKCGEPAQKFGKSRDGQQRYHCLECNKTFNEPKPLAGLATDPKLAAFALNMLLEGMSERATSRMTGLDKNTILRLMVQAGEQCFQFLADTMQHVDAKDIQCDEVWSFVGKKEKTAFFDGSAEGCGDAYIFTAIDRNTKLLFCFHVGRRTGEDATLFADKLAMCVSDGLRPHISTDGYNPYHTAIPSVVL
jgi:transposase-like protein/IS1 family transposase